MKILVYGAGVIGCIYSAKLFSAGADITLLARGERYEHLKQNGIILNDVLSGKQVQCKVPLTEDFGRSDFYDLIIVTVRLDQLEGVKIKLKQNTASRAIMFMLNNPDNLNQLATEFPNRTIILGFPGAGGTVQNGQINYVQIKEQKTTIGDLDGSITPITKDIEKLFKQAGFKVAISNNMQAWLKTHAVFIACVSAAITKENGNSIQAGKNRSTVQTMVKGINEGFRALHQLGIPILPANLKTIFLIMPKWFSVWYWQKALQGTTGTLAIAPHANAAKAEMQLLAEKVLTMVQASTLSTPTLDRLLEIFINSK
jgi:2-dehydropantoate 2-reductase